MKKNRSLARWAGLAAALCVVGLGTACRPADAGPITPVRLTTAPHGGSLLHLDAARQCVELVHQPDESRLLAWLLDAATGNALPVPADGVLHLVVYDTDSLGFTVERPLVLKPTVDATRWEGDAVWLNEPRLLTGKILTLPTGTENVHDLTFALARQSMGKIEVQGSFTTR